MNWTNWVDKDIAKHTRDINKDARNTILGSPSPQTVLKAAGRQTSPNVGSNSVARIAVPRLFSGAADDRRLGCHVGCHQRHRFDRPFTRRSTAPAGLRAPKASNYRDFHVGVLHHVWGWRALPKVSKGYFRRIRGLKRRAK